MSVGTNIQTVNFNKSVQSKVQMNFRAQSSTVKDYPLDTVEIKGEKKSKKKKTLLVLGIATLLGAGAVIGLREAHIKKAQKTFQEVFMRENISRKETVDILKRYKHIEEIKDKDEYIKAMFDEAKKNYGFKDFDKIQLRCEKMNDKFMDKDTAGSVVRGRPVINVRSTIGRKEAAETIHHELRHVKQNYYAANYNITQWLESINNKVEEINGKRYFFDKESLEQLWGMKFGRNNVPEKHYEFAQKVLDNHKNYIGSTVDKNAYRHQFVEDDAYNCGNKMESVIKILWNRLI